MIVAIYHPWQTVTTPARVKSPLQGLLLLSKEDLIPLLMPNILPVPYHNISSLKFPNLEQPCIYHDAASIIKLDQEYVRTVDHFHVVDTFTLFYS